MDLAPTSARNWLDVPEYALDRNGPLFRPFRPMGASFANIPVFDHFKNVAAQHPDKLAISDGVHRLTYAELLKSVETLARRIVAIVPEGRALGILTGNSSWCAVAMLASMAAGRPSAPLNVKDPTPRINQIATEAHLSAVIGIGSAPNGVVPNIEWIDITAKETPRKTPMPPPASFSPLSVDQPAIILYTSGSTGRPKGIVNSQRSLLQRVQQYVDACHINTSDVFLPLSGPATIAGCREMLAALLSGATLHLLDVEAVGLRAVRSRMRSENITISYLTPTLLRALMTGDSADSFKSLRVVRIGGERVLWADIRLLRNSISDACLVQIGYSSTETTGAQWFVPRNYPEDSASVPVGSCLPGITFSIVDDDGCPVQSGESGELLIRSNLVLLGYWENGAFMPLESDPRHPKLRVFATGDIVRIDDCGVLHIIGRKGRQIKINGRRIEPAELDRVLRSAVSVEDAVTIVTAATELVAFVVPNRPVGRNFSDEVRNIVKATLPSALRPSRLHVLVEIPRLPGGKINLAKLEEIDLSSRESAPTVQHQTADDNLTALLVVQRAWTKILNTPAAAGNWEDAGGDSLKLLHCILEIESAIGRELDLEAFTIGMSVSEMVTAVSRAQRNSHPPHADVNAPPVLFLLPGSVGYGPSLAAFAASMRDVARVTPIRYPSLQSILEGQNTLAAMAAHAIEQINRVQPSGYVRLLGHSLGGAVAFEVASRLAATGRSVKFLGILDTSIACEQSDDRETLVRTLHRIRTNRVTASRIACRALAKAAVAFSWETRLASILDRYARNQFNATCFRIKLELQEVLRAKSFFAWLAGPKPTLPIVGTLFRCARQQAPEALGWDSAFSRLDVVPIAGGHLDLVVEPHLATNRPLIEKAVAQTYSPTEALSQKQHLTHRRAGESVSGRRAAENARHETKT